MATVQLLLLPSMKTCSASSLILSREGIRCGEHRVCEPPFGTALILPGCSLPSVLASFSPNKLLHLSVNSHIQDDPSELQKKLLMDTVISSWPILQELSVVQAGENQNKMKSLKEVQLPVKRSCPCLPSLK